MHRVSVAALASSLSALAVTVAIASSSASQVRAPKAVNPASQPPVAPAPVASSTPNDVVKTFCVGCHNDKVSRGELSLASFDVSKAAEHADVAEKMVRKLR